MAHEPYEDCPYEICTYGCAGKCQYEQKAGAVKHDTGKVRYDLIPAYPLDRLAEVYTIGAKKYGDRNWEKGFPYGRLFAAMMRHAWAWWRGETHDPVDGQHHLASVAWGALALMEFEHKKTGQDDRPVEQKVA